MTIEFREKRREEKRRAIQESAHRVLSTKPAEKASIDEISRGAEMSVGGVYLHFPSKDDLLVSLLDDPASLGEPEWAGLLRLAAWGRDELTERALVSAQELLRDEGWRKAIAEGFVERLEVAIDDALDVARGAAAAAR